MWQRVIACSGRERIKKISLVLHGLVPESDIQPELLDALPQSGLKARMKAEHLSEAMDKINHRFGRDSILMGMLPSQGRSFSGTKIAFTRIPDAEEFLE
jgi:DNA polymerase-4